MEAHGVSKRLRMRAVDELQAKIAALDDKTIKIDVRASVLTEADLKVGRRYARGTSNAARGVALVGEEGPELVEFRGGERVLPANQTRQALMPVPAIAAGGGGGVMMPAMPPNKYSPQEPSE